MANAIEQTTDLIDEILDNMVKVLEDLNTRIEALEHE
jgi:Mg2+ and Co2+ transporter CorA